MLSIIIVLEYTCPNGTYFFPYHFNKDVEKTLSSSKEFLVDRLNDEATRFIDRQKKDAPFFLYLSHYAVHTQVHGKPEDVAYFQHKANAGKSAPSKNNPENIALMMIIQQRWPLIFQGILADRGLFIRFCEWVPKSISTETLTQASKDWAGYLASLPEESRKILSALSIDFSFIEFIHITNPNLNITDVELEEYIYFSAIGSMGMVRPDDLKFSQTVQPFGKKKNWMLRADVSDSILDRIEQITYTLPATIYHQHQRVTNRQDRFMINDTGNANIAIRIKVLMKNSSVLTYTHYLDLTG